jgi:hypothetical protein
MGFFKYVTGKSNEGFLQLAMIHFSGLPTFPDGAPCDMILNEKEHTLLFRSHFNKKLPTTTLPLEKVTFAGYDHILESKHQSKIDRAVAGGLLFGGVGAVVGAATTDDKKSVQKLFVIRYVSNDEEKVIALKENGNLNTAKFLNALQKYVPTNSDKSPGNVTL